MHTHYQLSELFSHMKYLTESNITGKLIKDRVGRSGRVLHCTHLNGDISLIFKLETNIIYQKIPLFHIFLVI